MTKRKVKEQIVIEIPSGPPKPVVKECPYLVVHDVGIMWHRLALLKRLRERLIQDHHYLLDAVILDYERSLRALDPPEDDGT